MAAKHILYFGRGTWTTGISGEVGCNSRQALRDQPRQSRDFPETKPGLTGLQIMIGQKIARGDRARVAAPCFEEGLSGDRALTLSLSLDTAHQERFGRKERLGGCGDQPVDF